MIERFNRILSEALSKLKEMYDWDKFVKLTLMAYNTSQQNNTKMTLYFLMYGRTARLPIEEEVFSRSTVEGKIVRFSSHYNINTRAFSKCRTFPVPRFLSLSSRLLPFTQRSTDLITMTFLSQRRFYLATRSVRLRHKLVI